MNSMRNLINDTTYLTNFIVGNKYASVLHRNKSFPEIMDALENFLGEVVKPFVVVSMTQVYYDEIHAMLDRDLVDVNMEE